MKVRSDFVTNSSSSSFIISKDTVSKEKLIEILIELANETYWYWDDEDEFVFTEDDVKYNEDDCICRVSNYFLNESTETHAYDPYDDEYYDLSENTTDGCKDYTNHWIVDNQSYCRYDWSTVNEVLGKHDLLWVPGYCD